MIISDPCPKCQGQGRIRKAESLSVKIPPGVDNGSRLKLRGEGEAGYGGGPQGDLYVVIHVKEHEMFVRQDNDVIIEAADQLSAGRARHRDRSADARRQGEAEDPGRARNRAKSCGSRARASSICTATDAATS